ncbi:hypothetical protein K440DRAFT_365749 [Wilcoxina mikolae CBS 423.85]|nr:hypothetical protein K440DRAFT_365749 [Wilcoxina mikolae CBS 423.85]
MITTCGGRGLFLRGKAFFMGFLVNFLGLHHFRGSLYRGVSGGTLCAEKGTRSLGVFWLYSPQILRLDTLE